MHPDTVISFLNIVVQVPITGRVVAIHEAGHARFAAVHEIDCEFISLNSHDDPLQGILLAELRISQTGLTQIDSDDDLALGLSLAGPTAEFLFMATKYPGIPLNHYFARSTDPGMGWHSDMPQVARSLFPEYQPDSQNPQAKLWERLESRFAFSLKELQESGDLARIIQLADDLLSHPSQRIFWPAVLPYFH